MTGFAAASGEVGKISWHWDLRSLNGRGLDMRLRLPPGYETIEVAVRELVSQAITRGSCQINLQIRRIGSASKLRINEDALAQALALIAHVSASAEVAPPRADGILSLKGVLEVVEQERTSLDIERDNTEILDGLKQALECLNAMRVSEGNELKKVLSAELDNICRLVSSINELPSRTREAQLERLRGQLKRVLDTGIGLSSERLEQEAALLANKADIREETERLNAHVEAARGLIVLDEAIGRRLDFLSQEFNREANTVCSKSSDIETTQYGLELKAVIEQFREQVQNVE